MSSVRDNIGPEAWPMKPRRLTQAEESVMNSALWKSVKVVSTPDHGETAMTDERVRYLVRQELISLGIVADKTGDI